MQVTPAVSIRPYFDTLRGRNLWTVVTMTWVSCPDKFNTMVRQYRDAMQGQVLNDNDDFAASQLLTIVCRDLVCSTWSLWLCVLMPSEGIMMLFTTINYSTGGWAFNLRREDFIGRAEYYPQFHFVNDCALKRGSLQVMQNYIDWFSNACAETGFWNAFTRINLCYTSTNLLQQAILGTRNLCQGPETRSGG